MFKYSFISIFVLFFFNAHSQYVFETSDKLLYENRLKMYNDSLNAFIIDSISTSESLSNGKYTEVNKDFFIKSYNSNGGNYEEYFLKGNRKPYRFFYYTELKQIGDFICYGYKRTNYYLTMDKRKPTQKIKFIYTEIKTEKIKKYVYDYMSIKTTLKIDNNLIDDLINHEFKEHTTSHLIFSFQSYTAKGYYKYNRHLKGWEIIEEGYIIEY